MNFTITKADISHLTDIQNLSQKLFEKEQSEYDPLFNLEWSHSVDGVEYFTKKLENEDTCTFLAVEDGKAIGYICGSLLPISSHRDTGKLAELDNLMVLKDYRSGGVGAALQDTFVEWCRDKKVKRIKVVASSSNERGISFYKDNGFTPYSSVLEMAI